MELNFQVPEFIQVDQKLSEIKKLASYDPLLTIVKDRFQQQITHYLTSLKSKNAPSTTLSNASKKADTQQLKQSYLLAGKKHAVIQLVFDLTKQEITAASILLLAEILFDETGYRQREFFISSISGNRQSTTKAADVALEMEKLIYWHNKVSKRDNLDPIVKASFLHHKLTAIHPFNDWNGRIARLLLNISLMNSGLLPILINQNDRLTYYESLELADKGDLKPLAQFISRKELETIDEFMNSPEYVSIKAKLELKKQLDNVSGNEKCIILTEDSATQNLLETLLKSSGFNLNETNIISYEGCSKIGSANLFSIFVKEKMPYVKILVHRDRDYLTNEELDLQRDSFKRIDVGFFITKGTDVESYFLNPKHVAFCFPSINLELAENLIKEVMDDVFPKSVDYLRKKEFGGHKTKIHTHLNKALEDLVSENLFRFTHGKTALKILEYKLNDLTHEKRSIKNASPYLCIEELQTFAKTIWK